MKESATKKYFDEQFTKFGNKQGNGSLARGELTAKANSLGTGGAKSMSNGGRPKQKGKYFKSAVFERTT